MKIKGEKISWIMSHLCDGNADFAEKLGEKVNTVSNWVSRGCGLNVAEKICNVFPDINMNWLIMDKGEPLLKNNSIEESLEAKRGLPDGMYELSGNTIKATSNSSDVRALTNSVYVQETLIHVPYVPLSATASFVESLYSTGYEMDTYGIMQEEDEVLNGDYMVFQVNGDSMEPTIPNGSKILAQKIDECKWENVDGVVVVVYGKVLTVKRIKKNALYYDNKLILKADNPVHGEMEVEFREIRGIWKAKRIVSKDIV